MATLFDNLYNRKIKGKLTIEDTDELNGLVKIRTSSNISELSDEVLDSLKVGDVVQKITGNEKHCYIVTYKEEHKGICLSYFDCGYLETISYDYTAGHWVFNSKDVCEVQEKITSNTDLVVKTIQQTQPNETLSFNINPTPAVEEYFTKLGEYCKIEVVNGELHIIACAEFQNTDTNSHDLGLAQQDIVLPDSLAEKIYGVGTGKNLLEDNAGDVRIGVQTYSIDVDGSNKNVASCRIFSTAKNHLRIIWNPLNNIGAGKKCSTYCEVNLSLF